jgi:hypothetical protein
MTGERHGNSMGTAWYAWIGLDTLNYSAVSLAKNSVIKYFPCQIRSWNVSHTVTVKSIPSASSCDTAIARYVNSWVVSCRSLIAILAQLRYCHLESILRVRLSSKVYQLRSTMGHAVAQWLRHCATNRIDSRWCHWNFSFRPHYGPGVDSASNRNEYQEYFVEVKAAGT